MPDFKPPPSLFPIRILQAEELGKKEFSPCLHSQLRPAHMFLLNSKQGGASISTAILDIIKA